MDEIRQDVKGTLVVQGVKSLSPFILAAVVYAIAKALGIIKILGEANKGMLGFLPSFSGMFTQFIAIVAFAVVAVLAVVLMGARNTKYVFAPEGIIAYGGLITESVTGEVPYRSISRITMKSYPLTGTGKIMLELSGMEKQKFEMDFIRNPAEVSQYIEAIRR